MNVTIKTPEEIEKMRIAGRLAAEVLEMIEPYVQPGVTTGELDRICHEHIVEKQQAIPAPLNYRGFTKSICTSINHVICHGIPDDGKVLKKGDIINLDITVKKDGYHGDTSKMFYVGEPSVLARRLVEFTREALYASIALVKPGARLSDIGKLIERMAAKERFSIVQEYCGHGIGKGFHEDPQVLHYDGYTPRTDLVLAEGMCFTIEPMINTGSRHCKTLKDGWTVVTKDHGLSAQWEHTVLVTAEGVEVLTRRSDEHF